MGEPPGLLAGLEPWQRDIWEQALEAREHGRRLVVLMPRWPAKEPVRQWVADHLPGVMVW